MLNKKRIVKKRNKKKSLSCENEKTGDKVDKDIYSDESPKKYKNSKKKNQKIKKKNEKIKINNNNNNINLNQDQNNLLTQTNINNKILKKMP